MFNLSFKWKTRSEQASIFSFSHYFIEEKIASVIVKAYGR